MCLHIISVLIFLIKEGHSACLFLYIITMDHGCRHPTLLTLTDSQAVIVCCTLQVSYGLVVVVDISRKYSKPLVCISTLLHHCRICHTATHTCTHLAGLPN